jgi:hypothetical protein
MVERLRFHRHVASDLGNAVDWYDHISPQLGNRFRETVDAAFDDIEAHAQRFPIVFDDVRFARVRRFPYLILFREVRQSAFVLGVFHGASNPERWRQRLE